MWLFTKTGMGRLEPWAEVCKPLVLAYQSLLLLGGQGSGGTFTEVEGSQVSGEQLVTASLFRTCENRFLFKGWDRLQKGISSD